MVIANIRGVITLAACVVAVTCASPSAQATEQPLPSATITFHNQGRNRIQVYLVGEKQDWLLGRLEPLQTARFALPELGNGPAPRTLALAVVPGWFKNLQPGRDPEAVVSVDEPSDHLPGEEWIFVNGQIDGPLHGRPR